MKINTNIYWLAVIILNIAVQHQISGQDFEEVAKIHAQNRAPADHFGWSVDIFGKNVIVGAPQDDKDVNNENLINTAGAAYLFTKDNLGNWILTQKIVAADRGEYDWFGMSVAISESYAIVGAWQDNEDTNGTNPLPSAGSAYIFEPNNNGSWVQTQKIVASDRSSFDIFGKQVAISGNYIVVGAMDEDEDETGINTLSKAGAAYVFERDNSGNWNQTQKLVAQDRSAGDNFGGAVAISDTYILIGAPQEDHNASGGNFLDFSGSAYIFEKDNSGTWRQVQKIVPSDREEGDFFGRSLSISGNYIVTGASVEDHDAAGVNFMDNAGSAYIFQRNNGGSWIEIQKIVANDRSPGDLFGVSVAISDNNVIVGARREDEDDTNANTVTDAGSAYVFEGPVILGLGNHNLSLQKAIYPNPFSNRLNVELTKFTTNLEIIISNINGRVMFSSKSHNNLIINTEEWTSGIYLLTLSSQSTNQTITLIKQ